PLFFPVNVSENKLDAPSCSTDKSSTTGNGLMCIEYDTYSQSDLGFLANECKGENGYWSLDGCPRAQALFGCRNGRLLRDGHIIFTIWYYSALDEEKYDNNYTCSGGIYYP